MNTFEYIIAGWNKVISSVLKRFWGFVLFFLISPGYVVVMMFSVIPIDSLNRKDCPWVYR